MGLKAVNCEDCGTVLADYWSFSRCSRCIWIKADRAAGRAFTILCSQCGGPLTKQPELGCCACARCKRRVPPPSFIWT